MAITARLRPSQISVKSGNPVPVGFEEIKNDMAANTLVIIRAYVKPNPKHRGFWSVSNGGGFVYKGTVGGIPNNLAHLALEKGCHVIILTAVQDGVVHTYRSAPILAK
jgi:hypothetical protein